MDPHCLTAKLSVTRRLRFCSAALVVFLIGQLLVDAQELGPSLSTSAVAGIAADPLGRDSPQGAVLGFLQTCRTQDYQQATVYMDLRSLTPAQRFVEGPKLAR